MDRRFLNRQPARAQLVDVLHHDYAGLHRNAEQCQEADARRYAEVRPREIEREQTAERRDGQVDQVQARALKGTERRK